LRRIGAAVLIPSLFNTNEPLMFSLPLVFNPAFTIPYILVPTVTAVTTYYAIANNLVARPVAYVPSATPILISVFLATLDWRAIVLVLVNLAIGAAIYAPFLRSYEQKELAKGRAQAASA
jgi:PTS system cellobiose-specific IIC component